MATTLTQCLINALAAMGVRELQLLKNMLIGYLVILNENLVEQSLQKVDEFIIVNAAKLQLTGVEKILSVVQIFDTIPGASFAGCDQLDQYLQTVRADLQILTASAQAIEGRINRFLRLEDLRRIAQEAASAEQALTTAIIGEIDNIIADLQKGVQTLAKTV